MRIFYLVLGLGGLACAALQGLAAEGRVELRIWPFVQTPNRALRWAYAGGLLVMSVLLLGLAVAPTPSEQLDGCHQPPGVG